MDLRTAQQPMSASRPTVVILSNDRVFVRELTANWPSDPNPPEFTVLEEGMFRDLAGGQYDLAIADASSAQLYFALRQALSSASRPSILIHTDSASGVSRSEGSVIELRRNQSNAQEPNTESWAQIAGLLGREILRRRAAEARQQNAERIRSAVEAEAVLGRYMIETRYNANNALTSLLGNAELLIAEPGLGANVVSQADTIRNMALRLHEIFQRFASIENELSVAARESSKRTQSARGTAAGR